MRYIINDDDVEDWYSRLYKVTKELSAGENLAHEQIDYVLSQMELEFEANVPEENMQRFLELLKNKY